MITLGAEQYDRNGYYLRVGEVTQVARQRAVRLMLLAVREFGLSAEQIAEWSTGSWFPHLRWDPEILDLLPRAVTDVHGLDHPLAGLRLTTKGLNLWGDPQIVVRLPDRPEDVEAYRYPSPHIDSLPDWANSDTMSYPAVFGVAVTDTVVRVWRGTHRPIDPATEPSTVDVHFGAGDVLVMHPGLLHASVPNDTGSVRCVVYFRPVIEHAR